jgi:CHAT domain-containing protein
MSSAAPARRGLALAERAYDLVQVRPTRAVALAERASALARAERDAEALVAALHALSWAQRVMGDPRAMRTARAGIRIGEKNGARRRVALLRRNYAHGLAFAGYTEAARREMERAVADLHGRDRAESEVFRIAIHRRAHAVDPAAHRSVLRAAASALRVLDGDDIWQARLLNNRGALHLDRGELDAAEADLRRAVELYRRVGAGAAASDSAVGLAEVALMRGDLLGCLATIDDLKAALPEGSPTFSLDYCRAVALAHARLLPEAAAAIDAYIESCARSGRGDYRANALIDAATIAIRSGDTASALRFSRRALRSFAARSKNVDAARARTVYLRARLATGTVRRSSVRACIEAANVLETAGWRLDALRTHLLAARLALAAGADAVAQQQLALARRLSTRGTVADRIELSYVRALSQVADGKVTVAPRTLKDGLRLLEEYRAALGAVELRATASQLGTELAEAGLRLALASSTPTRALEWAELLRANALRLPFDRPSSDPKLRTLLAELRRLDNQRQASERQGRPLPRLAARQAQIETAIRARTRRVRGGSAPLPTTPTLRELARALGDRVLVEYVELDGRLSALTIARGRLALHDLGDVSPATELEWLRFGLSRLARAKGSMRRTARQTAAAAAGRLDQMLIEPLQMPVHDAPLVIVPTGPLHALPWAALPSLHGRPVVVAPSLSLWLRLAMRRGRRRGKTVLVAGPRLRHTAAEVRELAASTPEAIVLQGKAATAAAALEAIEGATLVHIACHGRFRADSPLFSSLELADGPLTALDLQRLRRPPDLLVLSVCDLALSYRHAGDELLGFSASMLAMGTRTIVASVVPVPDAAARRLMLAFHAEVARGVSPASALARAQVSSGRASPSGFVCLGVG